MSYIVLKIHTSAQKKIKIDFQNLGEIKGLNWYTTRVSTENRKSKIFEIFDVRKYFEPFEKNLRNFEFSRNFRQKFFGFVRKFSTKISKIFENLFEKIKNAQNRLIRWENRKKNFHFEPKIVEKILVAVNIRDAS